MITVLWIHLVGWFIFFCLFMIAVFPTVTSETDPEKLSRAGAVALMGLIAMIWPLYLIFLFLLAIVLWKETSSK